MEFFLTEVALQWVDAVFLALEETPGANIDVVNEKRQPLLLLVRRLAFCGNRDEGIAFELSGKNGKQSFGNALLALLRVTMLDVTNACHPIVDDCAGRWNDGFE